MAPPPGLLQASVKSISLETCLKGVEDGCDSSLSTSYATSDSPNSPKSCLESLDDAATNSSLEDFHLDHDEPLVHLDKHSQLCLGKLSFAVRAGLILPIISDCAQHLRLTKSLDSIAQLMRLINEHPDLSKSGAAMNVTSGDMHHLMRGLKNIQMMDLVEVLKFQEAPISVRISIDTLACELEQELNPVSHRRQASKSKLGR